MPLIFAYGANLDRAAMAERCPGARAVGPARLAGYRFIIMEAGYATVLPDPTAVVHGLMWDVPDADLPALDAYEEVDAGLYRRAVLPVTTDGADRHDAHVYLASSTSVGRPCPGYMEAVLHAAAACALPASYRAELRRWLPAPEVKAPPPRSQRSGRTRP